MGPGTHPSLRALNSYWTVKTTVSSEEPLGCLLQSLIPALQRIYATSSAYNPRHTALAISQSQPESNSGVPHCGFCPLQKPCSAIAPPLREAVSAGQYFFNAILQNVLAQQMPVQLGVERGVFRAHVFAHCVLFVPVKQHKEIPLSDGQQVKDPARTPFCGRIDLEKPRALRQILSRERLGQIGPCSMQECRFVGRSVCQTLVCGSAQKYTDPQLRLAEIYFYPRARRFRPSWPGFRRQPPPRRPGAWRSDQTGCCGW